MHNACFVWWRHFNCCQTHFIPAPCSKNLFDAAWSTYTQIQLESSITFLYLSILLKLCEIMKMAALHAVLVLSVADCLLWCMGQQIQNDVVQIVLGFSQNCSICRLMFLWITHKKSFSESLKISKSYKW